MENKIWYTRDRKCSSAQSARGRCLLPEEREEKYLLKAFKRPHLKYGYREKEGLALQTREIKSVMCGGINKGKLQSKRNLVFRNPKALALLKRRVKGGRKESDKVRERSSGQITMELGFFAEKFRIFLKDTDKT